MNKVATGFEILHSSMFGRQVATLVSGTMIAQAIPILFTPVLTRLYSPADMGVLGLFVAFISFLTNALSLGYSQAIVTGQDHDEGAEIAVLSALIIFPMSLLGALGLLFLSHSGHFGYGELPAWTALLMAASLALTGMFYALRYWLVRMGEFREIAGATVAQSIGRIGTQVVGGLLGVQWVGLLLGEVLGRGFGLGRLWKTARVGIMPRLHSSNASTLRSIALRYRKFPLYTAPSSLLNALSLVAPVPLITMYFGIEPAGQFAIASRIMILPLSLVGTSVGDVFHSRIADLSRRYPDRAPRFFFVVVLGLLSTAILPALVAVAWGEELISVVLGSAWTQAGAIAASIVPWVMMQFVVNPVSRLVQVYQGQELKVVYDIIAVVSVVGVLSYGGSADWSIVKTTTLLGWSQAIAYGIYLLLLIRILVKYQYINWRDHGEKQREV